MSSWTYRSEELRGGDGWAVAVQLDPTAQVKITDLHWGNLAKTYKFRIIPIHLDFVYSYKNYSWEQIFELSFIITVVCYHNLWVNYQTYHPISCPLNCWDSNMVAVNSPCPPSHRECSQVSGLYVPFLKNENNESIFLSPTSGQAVRMCVPWSIWTTNNHVSNLSNVRNGIPKSNLGPLWTVGN